MQCDICGKEVQLVKADIEGTILNVCTNCGRFGKILSKPMQDVPVARRKPAQKQQEQGIISFIVKDYATIVKNGRERLGLKQEDLAKNINEKESVIHNIESGKLEPPIELAKKLEHFLRVKLVEEYKEESEGGAKMKGEGLTIGDVIHLD